VVIESQTVGLKLGALAQLASIAGILVRLLSFWRHGGKILMITIVSGLPRSGTSLMMQMLVAGGMTALSDGERKPDPDNPNGYLEWERIKRLPKEPGLITEAEGKVVKVISQLILSLPDGPAYRIIFMQRPMAEVLKSQEEMLKRRGTHDSGGNAAAIEQVFQRHLIEVGGWLAAKGNAKVLRVPYHRVLQEPQAVATEVAGFLDVALDIKAMVGQVDTSLYRNRMK
jgi:hypothetical protein